MSVLTLGETMVLLDPLDEGPFRTGARFTLRVAGAESNFGIALVRLGVAVTWVSRLGDDPFGDLVARTLAGEGLVLRVARDPVRPTGVFFKERSSGRSTVVYFRAGSAASALGPADVPDDALDGVSLVHLTGITMALGAGPRAAVADVARRARERGITVVFDPNYRPALWEGPRAAAYAHREVLPYADWYLCGLDEGCALFGVTAPEELFAAVRDGGARAAVVRVGARGALVDTEEGLLEVPPQRVEAVLDEVGAGDGFAAGFSYGLLQGWPPEECVDIANQVAAAALRGTGDWETFPREVRRPAPQSRR